MLVEDGVANGDFKGTIIVKKVAVAVLPETHMKLSPYLTRIRLSFTCALLLSVVPAAQAQPAQEVAQQQRPRVCVALSGGGARGIAHIGVLRVLEQLRVPVDCIAGTSMGAVVGSLYAAGVSANDLQRHLGGLDWAELRTQGENRLALTPRRREEQYDLNFPFDVTVTNGKVGLPSRILSADEFEALLAQWSGNAAHTSDFANLPIPFVAVAARLGNGELTLLKSGNLARAARASMSVPGLFSPAKIDGWAYLDGGLVQNLPVATARSMGADHVIAVNVGTPLADERDVTSFVDVAMQMMQILTEANVKEQISREIRAGDVLITPDLKGVGFMDFLKADGISAVGEAAAREQLDKLKALSLSEADYQVHRAQRQQRLLALAPASPTSPNPGLAQTLLNMVLAAPIGSIAKTAEDTLTGPPEPGVQHLKFGAALGTDFTRSYMRINVGHRMMLGDSNMEWRNLGEIGRVQRWTSDLWVPLRQDGALFVSPSVDIHRRVLPLFQDGIRVMDLHNNHSTLALEAGFTSRQWGDLRFGPAYEHDRVTAPEGGYFSQVSNSFQRFGGVSSSTVALRTRWIRDTLDNALLPRSGQRVVAEISRGHSAGNRANGFTYGALDWLGASTWHKTTLEGYWSAGGYSSNSTESPRVFTLGGFQRLSGFADDQFLSPRISFVRGVVRHELTALGALGYKLYAGGSLEAARFTTPDFFAPSETGKRLHSSSVFLAAETPIGPLYFALSKPSQGPSRFYLFLGRP